MARASVPPRERSTGTIPHFEGIDVMDSHVRGDQTIEGHKAIYALAGVPIANIAEHSAQRYNSHHAMCGRAASKPTQPMMSTVEEFAMS